MFYGGMNKEQEGEESEKTGLTLDFLGGITDIPA